MEQIVGIVVPVFGLIGVGYGVAVSGLLRPEAGEGLADFVFTLAIPVLIFRVIATADFSTGVPWLLWLVFYIAFALAWVAGTLVMRRLFNRDARAGLVAGVSSAYGNALLIGIPLVLSAYGKEGAAVVSLLIAVHLPVLMTASAILIERALVADGLSPDANTKAITTSLMGALARNPIIIGLFAGILWRLTGLPIAGPARTVVDRVADVAATLALISVGMTLRRYGVSGNVRQALALGAIKLVAMPAVVFLLVAFVIPLPPVWAKAVVIAAACPTGVNAYLVASRFGTGQGLASNAITLTTGLAVITVAVWLNVVTWL